MPLQLHQITLSTRSKDLISKSATLGLNHLFQRIADDALNLAADYGRDIARSVVPVDTLELRNTQIVTGRKLSDSIDVFVTDDIHRGRGRPQPASQLAVTLNSGGLLRTQNSRPLIPGIVAIGARTPTRNWISVSDRLMRQNLPVYLNRAMSAAVYV